MSGKTALPAAMSSSPRIARRPSSGHPVLVDGRVWTPVAGEDALCAAVAF
jgi:hypothetical protein